MKTCRKCLEHYPDDYRFCPSCGTPYDPKDQPATIPSLPKSAHPAADFLCRALNLVITVLGLILWTAVFTQVKNPLGFVSFCLYGLSLIPSFYEKLDIHPFLRLVLRFLTSVFFLFIAMWLNFRD